MAGCIIAECGEPVKAKGLCNAHYKKKWLAEFRAKNPPKKANGMPISYSGPIICRVCGTERPHTDFYIRAPGKFRRTDCRFCLISRAKVSAERVEFADQRWLGRRNAALRRMYGITNADFEAMSIKQEGRCAICGRVPEVMRANSRTGRRWAALHVDHDHISGAVRGLLCIDCNRTLGRIETVGIHAFAMYLNMWDPVTETKVVG
jgi:recombination endonuclease VII